MTEVVTEENQGASVGATLKAGSGYNAPWVTLRGESPAEVEALADRLEESELLAKVARLGAVFGKLWVEQEPAPKPAPQAQAAQPAQQAGTPSAHNRGDIHPTETCTDCGQPVRFVKAGVSPKNNRPYELWTCGNRDHSAYFPKL